MGRENAGAQPELELHSRRQANISSWKCRLTPAEIEAVRERVDEAATRFYSDQDWAYDNEDAVPETMGN
jgi:hypothetical protein